ncbi:MAG: hypothetical protein H5T68_07215 [Chloroflexi bacterium]|nr:hypothetical protein [Chloroflexota bacterium]
MGTLLGQPFPPLSRFTWASLLPIFITLRELGVFASSYLLIVALVTVFAILIVLRYGRQRFVKSDLSGCE